MDQSDCSYFCDLMIKIYSYNHYQKLCLVDVPFNMMLPGCYYNWYQIQNDQIHLVRLCFPVPPTPTRRALPRGCRTMRAILNVMIKESTTQPAFTCSKLTIEKLEQGVKYVQR